jgi:hypothetical protein
LLRSSPRAQRPAVRYGPSAGEAVVDEVQIGVGRFLVDRAGEIGGAGICLNNKAAGVALRMEPAPPSVTDLVLDAPDQVFEAWRVIAAGDHAPDGCWSEFCAKVAALRPGRLWRYAQAGDLPGNGVTIDGTLLEELVAANTGRNVIAFTHKPVLGDPIAVENRRLIAAAIKAGFTINLSADNPAHADKLAELGIAPVVTVLARAYARRAVRHRFKRRPDQWAETIGEWRDRTAPLPRHTPAGRE